MFSSSDLERAWQQELGWTAALPKCLSATEFCDQMAGLVDQRQVVSTQELQWSDADNFITQTWLFRGSSDSQWAGRDSMPMQDKMQDKDRDNSVLAGCLKFLFV